MPTGPRALVPAASAAAGGALLVSCRNGPRELSEAMDPDDWALPLEELRCERSALTLSGDVDDDDAAFLDPLKDTGFEVER